MVREVFEDLSDDTGALCFVGWRCLICGEVLDATILRNRAAHPSPAITRTRRRFASSV